LAGQVPVQDAEHVLQQVREMRFCGRRILFGAHHEVSELLGDCGECR
jgi:hypothetical protein